MQRKQSLGRVAKRVVALVALGGLGFGMVLLSAVAGCARRSVAPTPPAEPPAAQRGQCSAPIDRELACKDWSTATAACEGVADSHTSYPARYPEASCYVAVRYREPGAVPTPDPVPPGCGYPAGPEVAAHLEREASKLDAIPSPSREQPPTDAEPQADDALTMPLACAMPAADRAAAARANAATLRATAKRIRGRRFPYAAVGTFGFGHGAMNASVLVPWRPGDACIDLDKTEMRRLSINRVRAGRAAAAYHGGVAPVITVSGGAVHADLYEAFMLSYLLQCLFHVPADAVLLDPCADHTHTNVRNTGALVQALGGRTAYVITDSGLQGGYLQDWTGFDLIGGSIDQRALRDFGYSLGSWHQASVGLESGFWFTPYRFWAEPAEGLGSFSCVR